MELEIKELEKLLQKELPLEYAVFACPIGSEFESHSEAVLGLDSGEKIPDGFVLFASTTEILRSQKEELGEDRQEWFESVGFSDSAYTWWLDDFIQKINVAQGRKKSSESSDYKPSTNGFVAFLSMLGSASAYDGAHKDDYDRLPHVRAARNASAREEALSKCPQDVVDVIRKNALTTVRVERKSNSKGDRYKCYDENGVLLGRVFGALSHRYWRNP